MQREACARLCISMDRSCYTPELGAVVFTVRSRMIFLFRNWKKSMSVGGAGYLQSISYLEGCLSNTCPTWMKTQVRGFTDGQMP